MFNNKINSQMGKEKVSYFVNKKRDRTKLDNSTVTTTTILQAGKPAFHSRKIMTFLSPPSRPARLSHPSTLIPSANRAFFHRGKAARA